MANLIGKRYAYALFEAGLELDKLEKFKDDISKVSNILMEEIGLKKVLSHPKVSKNEKKELLNNIFKDLISPEVLNFLYILVDKRREKSILEINKEFIKLYNEHKNIVEVTVVTSVTMNEKAKEKLAKTLQNRLNKKIKLKNIVDKDIIGGVLLKIGNKVVDGTIKGQLQEMEKAIKGA